MWPTLTQWLNWYDQESEMVSWGSDVMWQILMQRLSLFTNEWYNEGTLV
jgi:hypothetical protein